MINTFALIFMGILAVIYIYITIGLHLKEQKYNQDERWVTIKLKAAQTGYNFYKSLLVIIAFVVGWLLFESSMYKVSLSLIFIIFFDLILIGQILNVFAIKYYDKKM